MNQTLIESYASFCEWAPVSFLVVSENVFDPLIYYSHLLPVLLSLPLAFLILYLTPRQTLSKLFFVLIGLFSLWALLDLVLWAHPDPQMIMFVWSLLILLEPLIYVSAFMFAYFVLYERHMNVWHTAVLALGMLPVIVFLPTPLAIEYFDITNCYREVAEGPLVFYGYLLQICISVAILIHLIYHTYRTRYEKVKNSKLLTITGVLLFLLTFSFGNIVGSFTDDWTIGQYGIFGMPIMIAFIGYTISKYRIFNSKIILSQLLVGALAVTTFSLFFLQSLQLVKVVSATSLGIVIVLGALLIRSVKREVEQRQEIEKLAKRLEKANKQLKILDKMKSEFVSIASHQLRSPLTSIRGYASMLIEGSYGKLPVKAQEAIERIQESSRYMALSVEDYLNVSRIEAGNMKYEKSDFNLKELAEKIVDEVRPAALKKGLLLVFRSDCDGGCSVHADIGKVRQVILNLLDNAMKYTPKGSITVVAHDAIRKKKMYISIIDSGVGMSEETMDDVFDKFVRAKNANRVNVTGTGLGLFVARKMIGEMGGEITASSKGEGGGSTFRIELPLLKGPARP